MSEAFAVRGRIITPDQIIVDGAVIVEGEEIVWMGEATQAAASGYGHQIAVAPSPTDGRYIMPGLVDVHCHGGGGQSFPDAPTKEDAMTAVWEHRLHGTTTLVASLATDSPQALRRQAQMLADLADAQEIAGIHFEGPFISAGHCGAQNPDTIQAANPALVRELLIVTRGHTVSMTLAPEGKRAFGSGSVTEALIEGGAIPSFGHTSCSAAQMREAAQWTREKLGMTPVKRSSRYTVTHLFNGMAPFHHREPGPVLEMLADAASGGAVLELIGDGVHIHPDAIRAVYDLVGRDSIVFVTDAMAAAGMPDGEYVLAGLGVTVADGRAVLTDHPDSLAGGTAHLLDVVRTSWSGGIPLIDAVYMASAQGAKVLGDDSIGTVAPGKKADLLVVDEYLYPLAVYRRGVQVAAVPAA